MNTPAQAVAEAEYAVRSSARSRCSSPGTCTPPDRRRRLPARHVRRSTASTTTTRSGRSASSSASRRWCTARCSQHRVTRSISNYVYNHVDGLAAAHESLCKSLFLGGVTRRFPDLRIGFLEGGVAWACALFSGARRALGEAQPRRDLAARSRPARRRRAARRTSTEYGDDAVTGRIDELRDVLRAPGGAPGAASTSSPRAASTSADDLRALLRAQLLLRLRSRRPARGVGVPRRRQPARRADCGRSSAPTSRTGTCPT